MDDEWKVINTLDKNKWPKVHLRYYVFIVYFSVHLWQSLELA